MQLEKGIKMKKDGILFHTILFELFQLFHFRYQQAVITVSAGVDYIDFPGIRIAEDKKGVSQQVHLQNGFFHRHWFYREVLTFAT